MALLTHADFRDPAPNEACIGLELTNGEAEDSLLTAAIARLTSRLQRWCNDTFESVGPGTVEVDGRGGSRLYLPQRFTAVTAVKTRDETGTLSASLTASGYRLHSSLNTAGSDRINQDAILDWIDLLYGGTGLSVVGIGGSSYCWPNTPGSVQVTGTYGWTVTPPEIKRALALLVFDHFKRKLSDLRVADSIQVAGTIVRYAQPDPGLGIYSGIAEVDEVLRDFTRRQTVAVG